MLVSEGLIEEHIHGAFGVDFMTCSSDDIIDLCKKMTDYGISMIFPTIVSAPINVIKQRISIIKNAMSKKVSKSAKIMGIHLEGPFINPEKAGIHNPNDILQLTLDNFDKIYDEAIKIITLAPELDNNNVIDYIKSKNIFVSAGHTIATDLSKADQVTHLFNAMSPIHHRNKSTVLDALNNDNLPVEVIADSVHICNDVLKLIFKIKPSNKIFLISDALPLTHSDNSEFTFCSKTVYLKNNKIVDENGVLAGSCLLVTDIIKNLVDNNILYPHNAISMASYNMTRHYKIQNNAKVFWHDDMTIDGIEFFN